MNDAVTKRPPALGPLRGSYHGTWLTPSARQYRIHPERRIGADRCLFGCVGKYAQIALFCVHPLAYHPLCVLRGIW